MNCFGTLLAVQYAIVYAMHRHSAIVLKLLASKSRKWDYIIARSILIVY